ncbi:MAG: DUF2760 domain-containing protein [Planctomycetota bacterium]
MRIAMACRVFFKVLFNAGFASRAARLLTDETAAPATPAERESAAARPVARQAAKKGRSEAITLLATLQREARLVDMVKEPLANYSDAQVGAAARDVLRDCGQVIDRLFGLRPLVEQDEGSEIEVPAGYDAARVRLTGNVSGDPPFRGRLVHHGWLATKCEVPEWTGSEQSRSVVAPEEVEVA